ncbi:RagB/SusD family nutrient uptake outer membrane protein [Prevotella copri]|uniref:RagB/SusD family nutrient uptake outer membrane protein n=1 Tax=Segatella copri TaxID=165179 RepID=UPI001933B025|nr:RagB/SusD family nutrient uptake outer membrane protein [Segatella copri]MBM0264782.1 RagB/SusD family nutrient uptake outer membrane protein [Segatella copri]
MKQYIIGSMLLSSILLASCSLDETPRSKFSEKEAFSTSKLVYVNSVANVYSSIGNGLYGSDGGSVHTFQEFSSDASMIPGRQGDWVDGGAWQNIFLHNFESSVSKYNDVWNNLYRVIGLANSSIDRLNKYLGEHPEYAEYVYELRALRAVYYYYVMDLFGQVPLVVSSEVSANEVNQSNRSDVFKFVTSELAECIPHLSDSKSQNEGEYYGRITKAVAYMCMAKCAINAPVYTIDDTNPTSYSAFVGTDKSGKATASEEQGKTVSEMGKNINITLDGETRNAWETAVYCADQIASLGYRLQPSYADNFIVANQNSVENIWTRPNDCVNYKIDDYNIVRTLHYNHGGAIGYQGWNGACSSKQQMLVYGYGTANPDPRLKLNFYTDKDYMEETGKAVEDGAVKGKDLEYMPLAVKVDFTATDDPHAMKCAGARMKKYEFDKSTTQQYSFNNDLVIWRYADALLLKAEAEYRMGNKAEALTIVNEVRGRVAATPRTELTLNDILDERMLELAWEGVRRQDQIRFCTFTEPTADRFKGVTHNASAGDYNDDTQGYTMVYPIPYAVLNLNKKLHQNPGYTK